MKLYRHIILEPTVWNTYVSVMIGGTEKQWARLFDGCRVPPDHSAHFIECMTDMSKGGAITLSSKDALGYVFVYFRKAPRQTDPQDLGAVAHEMLHVTAKILGRKRMTLCDETEEAFAYLHEFLTRELWAKLMGKVHIHN